VAREGEGILGPHLIRLAGEKRVKLETSFRTVASMYEYVLLCVCLCVHTCAYVCILAVSWKDS
jgi:hypothetical protein